MNATNTTIWTGQACYVERRDQHTPRIAYTTEDATGRYYVVMPLAGDDLSIAEYRDRDYEVVDTAATEYRTVTVTAADMAIERARREDHLLVLAAKHSHRVALVGPRSRGFDGDLIPADLPQDS